MTLNLPLRLEEQLPNPQFIASVGYSFSTIVVKLVVVGFGKTLPKTNHKAKSMLKVKLILFLFRYRLDPRQYQPTIKPSMKHGAPISTIRTGTSRLMKLLKTSIIASLPIHYHHISPFSI
ncbi:MAG TPA: hypothetical protein VMS94_01225 [Acidobacteriota bacterium]|nr:hypothetical protein [Acidobacteriota bacterium]